ncbi:MAG: GNAT family N-acetyltransferase [Polyangiales bacterium]
MAGIVGAWIAEREQRIVGHLALRRGGGIGGALLDVACACAAARGLHPALDVVETNGDAIRLYERRGWKRVATEPWSEARDGKTLLHYYVAPRRT